MMRDFVNLGLVDRRALWRKLDSEWRRKGDPDIASRSIAVTGKLREVKFYDCCRKMMACAGHKIDSYTLLGDDTDTVYRGHKEDEVSAFAIDERSRRYVCTYMHGLR